MGCDDPALFPLWFWQLSEGHRLGRPGFLGALIPLGHIGMACGGEGVCRPVTWRFFPKPSSPGSKCAAVFQRAAWVCNLGISELCHFLTVTLGETAS